MDALPTLSSLRMKEDTKASLILIPRKCQLCSRLSSTVKRFWERLTGVGSDCRKANLNTQDDRLRADKLSAIPPMCGCEKYRTSRYSPGIIENDEKLTRFVFSPVHVSKKTGGVLPALFNQVHTSGCSVQRDSIADDSEIAAFVSTFLGAGGDRVWMGVVSAECQEVRGIRIENKGERALCVFDTAEKNNPAHGEVCRARVIDEADRVELRNHLYKAFNSKAVIAPGNYRAGGVWANLTDDLRSRSGLRA
jgi:hypothetical protein